MTVSAPFSAPAWPPETGASMKPRPRSRGFRVQFARDVGRGGGVVDEDRAALHAGEGAVGPERDRAQIVVVADAGEDEIAALGGGAGRRRRLAAVFGDPLPRLRAPVRL